jgi:hypothetical protein
VQAVACGRYVEVTGVRRTMRSWPACKRLAMEWEIEGFVAAYREVFRHIG